MALGNLVLKASEAAVVQDPGLLPRQAAGNDLAKTQVIHACDIWISICMHLR